MAAPLKFLLKTVRKLSNKKSQGYIAAHKLGPLKKKVDLRKSFRIE